MAGKPEVDAISGTATTGHEWDGLKELNTPLPRWWLYTFYACIIFAIVWSVFYPSVPTANSAALAVTGSTNRTDLVADLQKQAAARGPVFAKIATMEPAGIIADASLRQVALTGGKVAFNENCAACHSQGGAGQASYPVLADDDWIWGGTAEAIYQTIAHGIRSESGDTRISDMPAFGDGILDKNQISDVAEYVLSLSGGGDKAVAARGKAVFAEQCVSCHGEDGKGLKEFGGPNLTDQIWLFGGKKENIVAQITKPQMQVMPQWASRLDESTRKMLTVYVHSLGGGQ